MLDNLARRLRAWQLRNITRRKLNHLDDRLLADMGIERSHIDEIAARPAEQL